MSMTGTIIYKSPVIAGNQGVYPDGRASGFDMAITEGAYPSVPYRVVSATFEMEFRDATWATVTVHSLGDDAQLGVFGIGGQQHHQVPLATEYNYPGITGIRIKSAASQGASLKSGSQYTLTLTWELTDRPSAPTVTTPYVYAGQPLAVSCTPFRPEYRHVIAVGMSGQWVYGSMAPGETSGQVVLPMGWLTMMPSSYTGNLDVVLITYDGDREVGRVVSQAVMVAPPESAPSITLSVAKLLVVDGMTYPDLGMYVQSKCGYRAVISQAAGQYGATIASCHIIGGGYSGTGASLDSGLLYAAGDVAITCRVTDSRGITATQTATITVQPYAPPSPTAWTGVRADGSGNPAPMGTAGKVFAQWQHSDLRGANPCTAQGVIQVSGQWQAIPGIAQGAWTNVPGTLETTTKYTILLRLTDKYGQYDYTAEIPSAQYAMHLSADGEKLAFFKAADRPGVEIAPDKPFYAHGKELGAWMDSKTEMAQLWSGSWASGSITLSQSAAGYRLLVLVGAGGTMVIRQGGAAHASTRNLWGNAGTWHVVDNIYYLAINGTQLAMAHSQKMLNGTTIGAGDTITTVFGIK